MIKRLYDWVMRLAGHRHAVLWLAAISFVESSVFPIPPHVMLIPMVLANRDRAWLYAFVASAASVAGGWLGYGIGALLYDSIGRQLISLYHLDAGFAQFQAMFQHYGGWIVLAKGMTPIPFKLVTIASGAVGLDPLIFTVSAIASRFSVFFLITALLRQFGPKIQSFVEKRLMLVTSGFLLLVVSGFLLLRWI